MKNYSFSKVNRLRKRSSFLRISKEGKKIYEKDFLVIYTPGLTQQTRLGITISKRVGGAVTRNRIKRIIREIFRQNRKKFADVWDINIIAHKKAADINFQRAETSLDRIFQKIL